MISISHALTSSQAKDYYQTEYTSAALAAAEYYQEKGASRGEWFGKLAEEWGLKGEIKEEEFYRLIEGQDPKTGEQLVRHVESRKYINKYGKEVKTTEHRAGWDATFSMPKSLVILAYMSGDKELKDGIWQDHIDSVMDACREMEKFACARTGNGKWEQSGNLIASLHHHERARPDEENGYAAPNIHTHAVIMNMTRGPDGKMHAMQERQFFRAQSFLTAVYRIRMAERVQERGVELRVDLETGAPEVKGISREYIEAASVRNEEIKRKAAGMKERLEAEGHTVKEGAGLNQAAAKLNRKGKDFDPEDMARRDAEMEKKFNDQAHREAEAIRARGPIIRTEEEIERRARAAVTYGIEHAMEREAVNDAWLLMTKALERNMTLTTYDAVVAEVERREASGELIKIERDQRMPERTTRKMLDLERGNIKTLLDGKETQKPIASGEATKKLIGDISYRQGITLNENQYGSVTKLLESRDRIAILQGRAGVGKTTMMRVFREAAEREGFLVQGVAPTHQAAKEMRKSGVKSNTLESVIRSGKRKGGGKRYYIIDESSLADTRRMNALFKRIAPDDRVLFVGDRDQHEAIEAGAPFKQFQSHGVEVVWLTEVVRQKDLGYRAAVMLLQDGKIREAVNLLKEQGRIIEVKEADKRLAKVAELFVNSPESCLSVDPSNEGRITTNGMIHEGLQAAGRIDKEDHKTLILVSHDLTGADRKFAGAYTPDADVVRYRNGSEVYGIKKGEYGELKEVDFEQNLLTVEFRDKRQVTYDPARLSGVEVFRFANRQFSVGDRIQFRRETEDRKAANGELATIEEISGTHFVTRLLDGETVSVDTERFRHFDHGYAVTSHLSQGQTTPRVIVHIDTAIGEALVNERLSKVAFTRGEYDIVIVTNSIDELAGALERKRDNSIALEALLESEELRNAKARRAAATAAGAGAGESLPDLPGQNVYDAPEGAGIDSILRELEQDEALEFEFLSLDPEIPESLPEPMYDRVILGEAIVAEMRSQCAALDAEAARNYGRAFRLKVHDMSAGAEREISELDVQRRAEARGGRVASEYKGSSGARREMKERLSEQDLAEHSETLKAHNKAREDLVQKREEAEARTLAAHNEAGGSAQAIREKYQAKGEQTPVPYIGWETLNKIEDQAIRHGLTEEIGKLEELRAALAKEHRHETRTNYEASRLSAQRLTAQVEYQARLERLAGFEESRHLQRYEIEGKKWSIADLDRAIERASDRAKLFGKYDIHWDAGSRAAAAAEVKSLSGARETVIERIEERGKGLADQVEEARQLAEVLNSAYGREASAREAAGRSMPAPVLTAGELKRIETNLPSIRDEALIRQLPEMRLGAGIEVNQAGRALARELIAEIYYREAAERLAHFEEHGGRQALLIESPDGHLSAHRPDDYRPRSELARRLRPLWETTAQRETRESVETAFEQTHQRIAANYEKSLGYYRAALEQTGEGRREGEKPEFTPGERMRIEIFAERLKTPQEREIFLSIAREVPEQAETERMKATNQGANEHHSGLPDETPQSTEIRRQTRAGIARRHETNRDLLRTLSLNERERNELLARGLDEAAMERNGYKSVPEPAVMEEVVNRLEGRDLSGIPGFYREGGREGRWRLNIGAGQNGENHESGKPGFLVPVRDLRGRIEGFQIHYTEAKENEPRQVWLSSGNKQDGASIGSPAHCCNIEKARESGQIIVTEGALKADVASHLLGGQAAIAATGVKSFPEDFGQKLKNELPELRQVVLAFNQDSDRRPEAQQVIDRLGESLRAAGLDVRELKWDGKQGKGIDDYLRKDPARREEIETFLKESREAPGHDHERAASKMQEQREQLGNSVQLGL